MKKRLFIILIAALMVLMLAACGSSSQSSDQEGAEAAESEGSAATEDAVHPYAWLGLQDMPECSYLDILSTKHFIKESDMYIGGMSYVSKQTNAEDGINTFKEDESSKRYSVGGRILSINKNNKTYMEEDMSDMAESAQEQYTSAMENGTNLYGRSFTGTGSEAVPIYSEQTDDKSEYEYYEYHYPELEESGDSYIERFYLKDGDVFAIYDKTTWGDTVIESTEIINKMSGDIPEGTFELPDVSDYEKLEI